MIVTKTKRLLLRHFCDDDAGFILELLSDKGFIDNVADKGVRDLPGAIQYLVDGPYASYSRYGFGLWCLCLKDSGVAVGMAGLMKRDYLDGVDLGYALLPQFYGNGYATEAALSVIGYAQDFLNLSRVLALAKNGNRNSINILEALSFERVGGRGNDSLEQGIQLYELVL